MLKYILLVPMVAIALMGCSSNKSKDTSSSSAQSSYEQGNYSKAAADLLPKAKAGDAEAQYTLGYMYYYGQGVPRDRNQGYYWMQQSANQGNKDALKAIEMLNKSSTNPQG